MSKRIFPAEWALHAASWFTWPANPDTWTDAIDAVRRDLASAFVEIARGEPVLVNVASAEEAEQVHELTGGHPDVVTLNLPSNDSWCRDHGPTIVMEGGRPKAITWNYNAWGGKYPPYDLDAKLGAQMAACIGVPHEKASITLEGGALESNGEDILLTTASCVLNRNRNPGLTREDAERHLIERLGLPIVGWLEGELDGDDTDGHIDNLVRFSGPYSILIAESIAGLANILELNRLEQISGRTFRMDTLPSPPVLLHEGHPLPCSHMNFYVTNACVILPTYGGESDQTAQRTLTEHFPSHNIVPVDCRSIIRGLGAIHCLSQQIPAFDGFIRPTDDFLS